MTTWHITIVFQVPRGAVITDDVVTDIHDARPEFTMVSRIAADQLEFTVDADNASSAELYAMAIQRAADVSTDVLGFPVELLRAEIAEHGHWLDCQVRPAVPGEAPPTSLPVGSS